MSKITSTYFICLNNINFKNLYYQINILYTKSLRESPRGVTAKKGLNSSLEVTEFELQ